MVNPASPFTAKQRELLRTVDKKTMMYLATAVPTMYKKLCDNCKPQVFRLVMTKKSNRCLIVISRCVKCCHLLEPIKKKLGFEDDKGVENESVNGKNRIKI